MGTVRVGIIQARMSSTRLPGKVLMDLGDAPVLEWVVERVGRSRSLDAVVVATTTNPVDDPVAARATSIGAGVFRGSEEDVLGRYRGAAEAHRATTVVRVTADCPFIDPKLIDRVVAALENAGADYASNILEPRTYPRGLDVEACTFEALKTAAAEARKPAWREHVTPFLYRHPDRFRLAGIWHEEDFSGERWTLDTAEDLQLLRELVRLLGGRGFSWTDVLAEIGRHPELRALNRSVEQKSVD